MNFLPTDRNVHCSNFCPNKLMWAHEMTKAFLENQITREKSSNGTRIKLVPIKINQKQRCFSKSCPTVFADFLRTCSRRPLALANKLMWHMRRLTTAFWRNGLVEKRALIKGTPIKLVPIKINF